MLSTVAAASATAASVEPPKVAWIAGEPPAPWRADREVGDDAEHRAGRPHDARGVLVGLCLAELVELQLLLAN